MTVSLNPATFQFGSAACKALGRPRGGERGGHIVSPRTQLVLKCTHKLAVASNQFSPPHAAKDY